MRTLLDPENSTMIDRALVVRFAAPTSATGEDMVELHLHGGVAVVAATLRILATLPGLRPAEPGAFTRQAFDNGKLDLSQVEGLADLIGAETEVQRLQALDQAGGRLRDKVDEWRATLIDLLADTEAQLDFADEADVGAAPTMARDARVARLRAELGEALADSTRGERLREGLVVAVTGPPNVGKSSLVNALAKRDVAIVAATVGTTRDIIEVRLDIGGVPVTMIDTAGLRESDDPVEAEGIRRGRARAAKADLVLTVGGDLTALTAGQRVVSKVDLTGYPIGWRAGVLYVSAVEAGGVEPLETWLADRIRAIVRPGEPALVTRERHRMALARGDDALAEISDQADLVIVAECLRGAVRELASITGDVSANRILDAIFSRFCIGK